jgi:PIN domain nuclease of toxin-antitoxin system
LIYLDTHIVVWLYAGQMDKLSKLAKSLINGNDLYIAPIVRLELQYLQEIERITTTPNTIISELGDKLGLTVCPKEFNRAVARALKLSWTRDPFDRLIVAQADIDNSILITKDQTILKNYPEARWS